MAELLCPEPPAQCQLCERLVIYRSENTISEPNWFNDAVPSFGDENAELLIVGLAPGRMGANKTGRPFTGDYAGDLLYATLEKFGLSNSRYNRHADDGLMLKNCMITNAVRCVPPENKPTSEEIKTCGRFLLDRLKSLPKLKVVVALGKIAHDSVVRVCGDKLSAHPFAHSGQSTLPLGKKQIVLISSYHCSRYNTNTGRLTTQMFEKVFELALTYVTMKNN